MMALQTITGKQQFLGGAHCSELETIAAEGEGRGAIAILAPRCMDEIANHQR